MQLSNIFLPCVDQGGYRKFKFKIGELYHLGSDRNASQYTSVYNLIEGVCVWSDETPGFGSFGGKGGVVIIESEFENKKYSILYGHLTREVKKGDYIKKNYEIGKLIKYETKEYRADHLHWGVWDGGGLPPFNWGYSKEIKNWIDPDIFLKNYLNKTF